MNLAEQPDFLHIAPRKMNKEEGMEVYGIELGLGERLDAYYGEARAIKRKLANGVPEGKKERIGFRLRDIEERLIPELISRMQLS
jgi:hypothetical protein